MLEGFLEIAARWAVVALFVSAFSTSSLANAALYSRLGGAAVYDSDLNITWTANANINGLTDWATANTWAAGLVLDGYSGWRLPSTLQPDPSCDYQDKGSYGYHCSGGEMGHLFYTELGGIAGAGFHTSLFSNFQSGYYWPGTEFAPGTEGAWGFAFADGFQYDLYKTNSYYALAVRPGDVAAVPVPAAAWLFGSGLLGILGVARRRKIT